MRQEQCRLFVLNHPDEDCGGPLVNIKFCLMADFSIIIVGDCAKCEEKDIGLKYTLRQLMRWVKEIKQERTPLQPPLQTDWGAEDIALLHALGVCLPKPS